MNILSKFKRVIGNEIYYFVCFYNTLLLVKTPLSEKYGCLDWKCKVIIPIVYDEIFRLKGKFLQVKREGKWGVFNYSGREIIYCVWDYIYPPKENIFLVVKESRYASKYKFIDKKGRYLFREDYERAKPFSDGMAWIKKEKEGKWGAINKRGRLIIDYKYDSVECFKEGRSTVGIIDEKMSKDLEIINLNYGVIDKKGKEIVPVVHEYIGMNFFEGRIAVKIDGRYGYFDRNGKLVIPAIYNEIGCFESGLSWVKLDGKSFYISKYGKEGH